MTMHPIPSVTYIYAEDSSVACMIWRIFGGAPYAHGVELARCLAQCELVNGLFSEHIAEHAKRERVLCNGMRDLAAGVVSYLNAEDPESGDWYPRLGRCYLCDPYDGEIEAVWRYGVTCKPAGQIRLSIAHHAAGNVWRGDVAKFNPWLTRMYDDPTERDRMEAAKSRASARPGQCDCPRAGSHMGENRRPIGDSTPKVVSFDRYARAARDSVS